MEIKQKFFEDLSIIILENISVIYMNQLYVQDLW